MVQVLECPICGNQNLQTFLRSKDYTATYESFNILKCNSCDLLVTSPKPPEDEIERYYQSENYISHTATAKNLTDRLYLFARKFTLKQKLFLVSKHSPRKKLLDYGCGTGDFLKLASNKNWETFGVEPSTIPGAHHKTKIVKSLTEITENDFSAITLWHVLEHIPNLNETLRALRDKLDKTGTIFIAVPNFKSFDAAYYNESWAGYDVPRHLWHFSAKSMTKLLKKNDLRLIETRPMFLDALYVSQLSQKYRANNKFNMKGFLLGSLIGLRSNILAAIKGKEYSSLIFIAKK